MKKIIEQIYFNHDGNVITIRLAKKLIPSEISNGFGKLFVSKNDQIIISGKLVIQMDEDLTEIENIGCVLIQKAQSSMTYTFLSLLEEKSRKQLLSINNLA